MGRWSGGERGIRTPDRGFSPYNGLANRRLQPLGHLSSSVWIIAEIRLLPRDSAFTRRSGGRKHRTSPAVLVLAGSNCCYIHDNDLHQTNSEESPAAASDCGDLLHGVWRPVRP